ncbi:MAG: tandem-95 repeat protein, partial [bacterium]|nr:tandem-95 repeat protein [bacterium]
GGHRAGETASRLAVEAMIETFRERPVCAPETIVEGLNAAQRELIRQQNENPDLYGMRTTAVVLVADKGVALWGHVGDSRLYRFQDGALVHQTPDHSVTQALRDAGQIGRQQMRGDENRGRLTRVLGTESSPAEPEVEETPQPLAADEAFLLCTDGFWEHVEEEEMAIDLSKSRSPKQWLRLMEARLRSRAEGEYDNYTAVAVFCHTGQGKGLAAVPSPVAARTDRPSPKPSGGVQRRWASELSTSRRRRSPWTALLAALGVCAAALFAVYWFLLRPPPESNRPPQAVKDVVDTKDREPVKIPVLKNDRDADEDELLLASVESPQHGEVTWNEEGILTYTPHEGFSGRERFAYEVTDREAVSEGEVEVRVAATSTDRNHAPEPEDDLARVEPGTVVAILVLGNDWDRDGDELRLEAVGEPLHGQVYARPDGRVAYSSPEEFEGPDEFTYVVTDGELTAEAVVRVEVRAPTPVNRRPTTQGDQAEATSGQAVKIDVLGNDSDPDGDTLELAGVTAPQHGTAALNAEGTVTYTSKQGFEGTDRFTYLVTDGSLQNSAEVVVEVKPIDAAPDDGPPEGQGATPGDPAGEAPAPPPPAPPPEPPPPPQAGEIRTNGEGGLEYVWIPASPKGFWLGRTEVTIAAYRR